MAHMENALVLSKLIHFLETVFSRAIVLPSLWRGWPLIILGLSPCETQKLTPFPAGLSS